MAPCGGKKKNSPRNMKFGKSSQGKKPPKWAAASMPAKRGSLNTSAAGGALQKKVDQLQVQIEELRSGSKTQQKMDGLMTQATDLRKEVLIFV